MTNISERALYQGKREDNGEWIKGYLLGDEITGQYFIHASGCSVNESPKVGEEGVLHFLAFEVILDTVGQYIGLKDKNDQPIFEGHIVRIPSFNPSIMQIAFIEGAFCLADKNGNYVADIHYIHHAGRKECEIIGNIHDNPELFETNRIDSKKSWGILAGDRRYL